jgi:hypothetical protein
MKLKNVQAGDKILVISRYRKTEVEILSVGERSVKTVNGNSYSRKTGQPWGSPYSYTCAYSII